MSLWIKISFLKSQLLLSVKWGDGEGREGCVCVCVYVPLVGGTGCAVCLGLGGIAALTILPTQLQTAAME